MQILVNFADFKSDPKNKVLEIAALKWTPSTYFNVQVGQFRPYFWFRRYVSCRNFEILHLV